MPTRSATSPQRPVHRDVTARYLGELYARARALVERHYRRPLTLSTVARALATSPRQVQRAYAEAGLTTFAAHLRAVRLRNAAELLAHQPLTVTDVARLVGYRQPSHFVKAFRTRYGRTPGAFRDAARHRRAALEAGAIGGRAREPYPAANATATVPTARPRLPTARSATHRHARAGLCYSNPNSWRAFEAEDEDEGAPV
jgi:AraC-like DNA-binding protein